MLGFQEGLFYTELMSFGVMTDKPNNPRFKILSLSCTHTAELRALTPDGSDYKKQKLVYDAVILKSHRRAPRRRQAQVPVTVKSRLL